jgi:hypothetical protein
MGKAGAYSPMARRARQVRRVTGMARNEFRQERQPGVTYAGATGATSPPVKRLSPELVAAIAAYRAGRAT